MEIDDGVLRSRIKEAVSDGLQPLPYVLAGWECGSIAFHREDEYSDIDLNFLLEEACSADQVYVAVEAALETVSSIVARHSQPPGRYFKLKDGGEFLLVDVCIYRVGDLTEQLDKERHGVLRPLFDKGAWLRRDPAGNTPNLVNSAKRLKEHQEWFSVSQNFVRKEIIRDRRIEGLAAYWAYTLKPLVEILRMRYCPARWDFGMRYLNLDLPAPVYERLSQLIFVGENDDLTNHLTKAIAWAEQLLAELGRDTSPPLTDD